MGSRREHQSSGPGVGGWTLHKARQFDGSKYASSRAARRFVGECLQSVEASAAWSTMLTGELATNVIAHAHTDFDVVVSINDTTLRVEVHDDAAATDALRELVAHPAGSVPVKQMSGRGWFLVGSTAARFGLNDTTTGGKAVWFELPLDEECEPD